MWASNPLYVYEAKSRHIVWSVLRHFRVRRSVVVTKCANPSCNASFRYLREGRLFLLEPPPFGPAGEAEFQEGPHRSEYFWLCERCAHTMTITSDRIGHAVLASRAHGHLESITSQR